MSKNVKRVLISIWLLLCASFIFFKGVYSGWQEGRSDFSNYYSSAALLLEGEPISTFYDNESFEEKAIMVGVKDGAKFSPFPPATAFLYLPLTVFPPLQAKRIWLICNLTLLIVLIIQAKSICSLGYIEVILLLSLFTIPIASNLRLGQSYLLILVILFGFLKALKSKKHVFGGSILGIITSLKYFPLVYLFYTSSKLNKKLIGGFISAVILVFLLPVFADGLLPYKAFISEFWNHANGDLSGQGQFSFTFQSIDALLANLFIYDQQFNPSTLLDFPFLKGFIKLLFALTVLYFVVKVSKGKDQNNSDLANGVCVVAAALLIPASASYHLLLLIPAILLVINFLRKETKSWKEILITCILFFISCNVLPHHVPNIEWNHSINTILHFPRLYGLIALFIYLITLQKRYLRTDG